MGNGELKVSVPVTNTGKVAGKETVQLYVAAVSPRVPRPVKELKNFAKVALAPGETKRVELTVTARDLAYWDVGDHAWRTDAGDYRLLVGAASDDIRAEATVTVAK